MMLVSGREYATINPHDESEICKVAKASKIDVDRAVMAAKVSYHHTHHR